MSGKSVKKVQRQQILYTFTETAEKAGITNLTTFTSRWWPKILSAHEGLDCPPLRIQDGETKGGNPRWRVSAAGVEEAIAYRELMNSEGKTPQAKYQQYCQVIKGRYPELSGQLGDGDDKTDDSEPTELVAAEIVLHPSDRYQNHALTTYDNFVAEVSEDLGSDYAAVVGEMELHQVQADDAFEAELKAAVVQGLREGTQLYQVKQAARNSRIRDLSNRAANLTVGE